MGPVDASRSCGCNPHIFIVSRGLLPELCILLLYTKSTINLYVDAMATLNASRPCDGLNAGLLFPIGHLVVVIITLAYIHAQYNTVWATLVVD